MRASLLCMSPIDCFTSWQSRIVLTRPMSVGAMTPSPDGRYLVGSNTLCVPAPAQRLSVLTVCVRLIVSDSSLHNRHSPAAECRQSRGRPGRSEPRVNNRRNAPRVDTTHGQSCRSCVGWRSSRGSSALFYRGVSLIRNGGAGRNKQLGPDCLLPARNKQLAKFRVFRLPT